MIYRLDICVYLSRYRMKRGGVFRLHISVLESHLVIHHIHHSTQFIKARVHVEPDRAGHLLREGNLTVGRDPATEHGQAIFRHGVREEQGAHRVRRIRAIDHLHDCSPFPLTESGKDVITETISEERPL